MRTVTPRWMAATLVSLLATAGCSLLRPEPEPAGPSEEVRRLQDELLSARQQAVMDEVELRRLRARVEELEAAKAEAEALARGPRGLGREELPPLRPLESIESVDLDDDADESVPADRAAAPAPSSEAEDPPEARERPPVSAAAQALYDRGYTLYHQGSYREAEQELERFLVSFGDTELGDNAQYWIGESRLARGELEAALSAFEETIRRYPQGNKAPDALFKAGRALERMGDLEGARHAYEEVLRLFPDSDARGSAASRLDEL